MTTDLRLRVCLASWLLPLMIWVAFAATPAAAQTTSNPSGLPLPRFATTRSEPVNVRVGPGQRYEIAWIFIRSGQPVEIIQEFDTWRKIRDVEGAEGWVHQSLLSPRRGGFAKPGSGADRVAMRVRAAQDAPVRAWLSAGVAVEINECDGAWCQVRVQVPDGGDYRGFSRQGELWGTYADEVFD